MVDLFFYEMIMKFMLLIFDCVIIILVFFALFFFFFLLDGKENGKDAIKEAKDTENQDSDEPEEIFV